MNNREQIAAILREGVTWSPQAQVTIIHGAVEKIRAREKLAERRGIAKGLFIALLIIVGCLLLRRGSAYPVLTPEQQMEDTLVSRGWSRDKIRKVERFGIDHAKTAL